MYKHAKAHKPARPGLRRARAVVVRYTLTRNQWGWYVRRNHAAYETTAEAIAAFERPTRHGAAFARLYMLTRVAHCDERWTGGLVPSVMREAGDAAVRELWFADQARKAAR